MSLQEELIDFLQKEIAMTYSNDEVEKLKEQIKDAVGTVAFEDKIELLLQWYKTKKVAITEKQIKIIDKKIEELWKQI